MQPRPIVHNSGTDASRIVNQTVHDSGSEKLEVEVVGKNWKVDSRTAAAGAAIDGVDTTPGVVDPGLQPHSGRDEPEPEMVPEKFCACGETIPADKAAVRDECRACHTKRMAEVHAREKREEEERKREGFLESREWGRPKHRF